MIGPVKYVPNGPSFVIEKVPLVMSSLFSWPVFARSATSRVRRAYAPQRDLLGLVDHRDNKALMGKVDCDTEVHVPPGAYTLHPTL
jgi:hypothetical protein